MPISFAFLPVGDSGLGNNILVGFAGFTVQKLFFPVVVSPQIFTTQNIVNSSQELSESVMTHV